MHFWRMSMVGMMLALAACGGKDDGEESTALSACSTYTVTVNVTNPEGEPMTDAVVTAVLSSDPSQEVACAGAGGTYTCTITIAADWKFYAEALSYEPYGKELNLTTDVCTQTLDAQLMRESAV